MQLLEVNALHKRFGGLKAVSDLSFKVADNCIKSVIGPNGAGKTTLFNLISGFLTADSGTISFLGTTVGGRKPCRVAALGMARTFQHIQLFPHMTALDNVMMGRHLHTRAGFLAGMLRLPGSRREGREAEAKCREVLDFLGIGRLADSEATSLPYGQQRAVEMAGNHRIRAAHHRPPTGSAIGMCAAGVTALPAQTTPRRSASPGADTGTPPGPGPGPPPRRRS